MLSETAAKDRRAQALQAAQECMALLKERFGARRVILFGSLAQEGPWHDRSDIDLAVEGLPPEAFFRAYAACGALLPPGLELDLVPLESAGPELRARILGERKMPDEPLAALESLLEEELAALERVASEMEALLAQRNDPPTRIELRAMASILHEFYNGVERLLERLVLSQGETLPKGTFWHADLLVQVATPQEGHRPALIDAPLRDRLEEYLRFRHFFRHAYGYTLEWARLRWLAESLEETLERLRGQVRAFLASLREGSSRGT